MPQGKQVFDRVMQVIEQRIAAGDYVLTPLPGERRLALEMGVSYMTARKAVGRLLEKGVLSRRPNGTLFVAAQHPRDEGRGPIALLAPAYPSTHLLRCREIISRRCAAAGLLFRAVEYVHWFD
ncbi:MAG: GntR family transcriptional regulator, partial [Pirellulales bacterium]